MLTTSVGYHSEHLKMDPDGMALGGGNTHPDPFSGGSPPFTGGNEEEFEPVQLPPGALSEEQQAAVQQSHSALHSLHHPGASVASSHYPPHYSHLSAQLYHQQHSHHSHPHPHHSHHPQQPPPPSQWNPYGMNGYVGTGATGGGYHPLHHAPPMDASSYYYSSASGPPPNAQPPPSTYHPSNPSGGGQQSMALPGGPSPAGSHNTPSPQAHSEDGDNSDPHLRNNNVLKRPAVDYSSSSPHVHSLMNPGSYHPPLPPAKKAKAPKRKKKRDPNEPQKPVSAYALFFRDSQANIKAANPNAAFGDVSKIVASMWDGLDPDNKAAYKKRTENAKKEYLKKLAAYRASLVSKGSGSPINESGSTSVAGSNPSSAPPSSSNNHPPSYGPGAGPYAPYSYGEPPNNSNTGMKPSPNDGYNGPNSTPYPNSQQQLPRQPSYGPPVGAYLHPNQQMSNGGYGHHHPVSHPPSSVLPPNSTAPSDNRSSSSPPSGPSPLDSRTHLDPTTGHLVETEGGGAPPNGSNSNNANGAHHLHQQHHPHSSSGSNSSNNRGRRPLSCARPGCDNPISSNEAWSSNSEFCSNECVVGQCRDVYSSWSGASGPPSTAPPPPPPPNGQVQTQ